MKKHKDALIIDDPFERVIEGLHLNHIKNLNICYFKNKSFWLVN